MSRGRLAAAGLTAAGLLAAAACGPAGGGDGDGSGGARAAGGAGGVSAVSAVEAPYTRDALDVMAADQCSAENEALPLANSTVPQADVTTRASLLASQDALPVLFPASSESVRPDGDLVEGGLV